MKHFFSVISDQAKVKRAREKAGNSNKQSGNNQWINIDFVTYVNRVQYQLHRLSFFRFVIYSASECSRSLIPCWNVYALLAYFFI